MGRASVSTIGEEESARSRSIHLAVGLHLDRDPGINRLLRHVSQVKIRVDQVPPADSPRAGPGALQRRLSVNS